LGKDRKKTGDPQIMAKKDPRKKQPPLSSIKKKITTTVDQRIKTSVHESLGVDEVGAMAAENLVNVQRGATKDLKIGTSCPAVAARGDQGEV